MARKRLRKRRNFAHKLLSGAHTQAAISNPCLPIPNYVTTQLKKSIARAEREVKARGEVGARVLCVKISRVVLMALTTN